MITETGSVTSGVDMARRTIEPFFKNLFSEYDFCIRFPEEAKTAMLTSLASGDNKAARFKNSLEIDPRGTTYNQDRIKLAEKCFNYQHADTLDSSMFEKYGYLTEGDSNDSEYDVSVYGEFKGILNKNILFHRTSFTLGDSLDNNFGEGYLHASMVTNPSISSIPGVVEGNYSVLNALLDLICKSAPTMLGPLKICEKLKENLNDSSSFSLDYIELQFHGPIPWAYLEDVSDENGNSIFGGVRPRDITPEMAREML